MRQPQNDVRLYMYVRRKFAPQGVMLPLGGVTILWGCSGSCCRNVFGVRRGVAPQHFGVAPKISDTFWGDVVGAGVIYLAGGGGSPLFESLPLSFVACVGLWPARSGIRWLPLRLCRTSLSLSRSRSLSLSLHLSLSSELFGPLSCDVVCLLGHSPRFPMLSLVHAISRQLVGPEGSGNRHGHRTSPHPSVLVARLRLHSICCKSGHVKSLNGHPALVGHWAQALPPQG